MMNQTRESITTFDEKKKLIFYILLV